MCPKLKETLITKLAEFKALAIPNEDNVRKQLRLKTQLTQVEDEIRKIVMRPENVVPFLVPGRVIRVRTEGADWGWGVLSAFSK